MIELGYTYKVYLVGELADNSSAANTAKANRLFVAEKGL